jgi:alkanesulfonate monooxygenase SsuD/methylene tetrahydromethanopterin reductase-like flavin-dependent oxidoreductase (luciferase family)
MTRAETSFGIVRRMPVESRVEVGIYLPQVGFTYDEILERARWVEELGFHSLWLFDHLYFEGMDLPTFEGWTLASALLAQTTTLRVGHLVLCANFRHPVVLGKMASTLDVISGGRLMLGLGSGSVEDEHHRAGLPWGTFAERTERLETTLDTVTRMFAGQHEVPNTPLPTSRPPVIVGGGGARTLDLVARYADWWNCPTYSLSELDAKIAVLRDACARVNRDPDSIRLSTESVLALAATEAEVGEVTRLAERRFGADAWGLHASEHIGTPDTVVPRLRAAVDKGVSFFVFFLHDRVSRATLRLLAEEVVPHLNQGARE